MALNDMFKSFCVLFIGIFIEAIPFILIGALVAGIITTFLTEELIKKVLPKNKLGGAIVASLLGLFFPLCECATVPVTRGLVKKGVPTNIAITFMLAAPIVNPVVMLSTYQAFGQSAKVLLLRVGIGITLAIIIGFLLEVLNNNKYVLKEGNISFTCDCGCEELKKEKSLKVLIRHIGEELYSIGKYLIIGSILASLFQVVIPSDIVNRLAVNKLLAVIVMMVLSYLLSLCSEADAFVARSFLTQFSLGPVMAFLILGPMLDLKNNLMLFSGFKKGFVFKLMFLVFSSCFIVGCLI